VHPQISVSAVSSVQWTFDEDLAFWTQAGIDHVGLSLRKLEAAGIDAAVRRIADAGLRVSNIVELGWWDLRDDATWPRQQDRLLAAVDAAGVVGGCLVLTTGPAYPMEWDDAVAALDGAITPIRNHARARGVPLTVEPTSQLRMDLAFVHSFADALDLADEVGSPWLGVVLELNNAWIERALYDNIRRRTDRIAIVQVSDFKVGTMAASDRVMIGDGDIPLRRICSALADAGYDGWYDIELLGPAIEAEGYEAVVPRAVQRFRELWT